MTRKVFYVLLMIFGLILCYQGEDKTTTTQVVLAVFYTIAAYAAVYKYYKHEKFSRFKSLFIAVLTLLSILLIYYLVLLAIDFNAGYALVACFLISVFIMAYER